MWNGKRQRQFASSGTPYVSKIRIAFQISEGIVATGDNRQPQQDATPDSSVRIKMSEIHPARFFNEATSKAKGKSKLSTIQGSNVGLNLLEKLPTLYAERFRLRPFFTVRLVLRKYEHEEDVPIWNRCVASQAIPHARLNDINSRRRPRSSCPVRAFKILISNKPKNRLLLTDC